MGATHHVLWLEIPVDYRAAVGIPHGLTDFPKDLDQPAKVPAFPGGSPLALGGVFVKGQNGVVQGEGLDLLHCVVPAPIGQSSNLVDGTNARVVQLGGDLGFFDEPGHQVPGAQELRPHDLHGEHAVQLSVSDPKDLPHGPRGNPRDLLVALILQDGSQYEAFVLGGLG